MIIGLAGSPSCLRSSGSFAGNGVDGYNVTWTFSRHCDPPGSWELCRLF
jgi:hypothetical protein